MKIAWEKWTPRNKKVTKDGWEDDIVEYRDENIEETYDHIMVPGQLIEDMIEANSELYTDDDYNFWTGHSDFPISFNVMKKLCDTPGVEAADLVTQYRFRIAVGKLFAAKSVMENINKSLLEYVNGSKQSQDTIFP